MPLLLDRPALTPWMSPQMRRNPGMQPLDPADWLHRDACFADQMALRDRLIAARRDAVFAADPDPRAAQEVLSLVLSALGEADPPGPVIVRADGVEVPTDLPPLMLAGRLVQEDLVILQPRDGGWVLTDAVLCFPSHWTLHQKLGRDLDPIHAPVAFYAGDLARRVRRLFDAMRAERPMWRANWLIYPDAELHVPRLEYEEKRVNWDAGLYVRTERQSLLKLPETGAVLFSIKTDICPLGGLDTDQRAGLPDAFDDLGEAERAHKGGTRVRALLAAAQG